MAQKVFLQRLYRLAGSLMGVSSLGVALRFRPALTMAAQETHE